MKVVQFSMLLTRAVEEGLVAVALVDRDGNTVDLAGAIADDEAMPLAALVMHRLERADVASQLFAGEVLSLALAGRDVAVGIARRQLFVVAILGPSSATSLELVRELRDDVAQMLPDTSKEIEPAPPSSRGGGSGPAQLPLIEFGITMRRERDKA